MFSEATSEHLILKNLLESMPIDPPSCCMVVVMCPLNVKCLPPPMPFMSVQMKFTQRAAAKRLNSHKNCLDKLGNTSVQHSDTKQLSNVDHQVVNLGLVMIPTINTRGGDLHIYVYP